MSKQTEENRSQVFDLFAKVEAETKANDKGYFVRQVNYKDTIDFILNIHYAKRIPSISYAYGLFHKSELTGVVTYGKPASRFLCEGICGVEYSPIVFELNRLVLKNNKKNESSFLISQSLKMLPKPLIIVSYADTEQNHVGYVYQATNFLFTGTTKARTDMVGEDGKHSRHHLGDPDRRKKRWAKHRYVFFVGNKKDKKNLLSKLNYQIAPYPKAPEA